MWKVKITKLNSGINGKWGKKIHHNLCLGAKACIIITACEDNFAYAIISFAFFLHCLKKL